MSLRFAIFLTFFVSFVSVSMEILWVSVISYILKSKAGTFSLVLSVVLIGIAFGAKISAVICGKYSHAKIKTFLSKYLFFAGILNFIGLPLVVHLIALNYYFFFNVIYVLIAVVSFLLGVAFPTICNLVLPKNEKLFGLYTSWIYASCILGSTIGPLLTGYVLLDNFDIEWNISFFSIICIILSILIDFFSTRHHKQHLVKIAVSLIILVSTPIFYNNFFEVIHFGESYNDRSEFKQFLQNKSGMVSIIEDEHGDIVYGNGVYDGRASIDIKKNKNKILRAYEIVSLHYNPKNILVIGLSTGAWVKTISENINIDQITAIEINPKYLEVIEEYESINSILTDPKVNIVIDDGRRWIHRNQDKKFDMIIMNTTFYWRSFATNLLSKEFLELCKSRLLPGGILAWNSTSCKDNIFTGAHVFDYVYMVDNIIIGTLNPLSLTFQERKIALLNFNRNEKSLFLKDSINKVILDNISKKPLVNIKDEILGEKGLFVITDDNLASEFKVDNLFWKFYMDRNNK